MALHKDLTGADLHEPKGIESAAEDTVYVADGSGSGNWAPRYDGVLNLNEYHQQAYMTDISTAGNKTYVKVPVQSELVSVSAIIHGTLTTGNAILSVYINGVLFPQSLTVVQSGSTAGQIFTLSVTSTNTIAAGSVIEIRSDGGSDTTTPVNIDVGLRAK